MAPGAYLAAAVDDGVDIAPAIPVLEKLIESEDDAIRMNATRALDAAVGKVRPIPYLPDWASARG